MSLLKQVALVAFAFGLLLCTTAFGQKKPLLPAAKHIQAAYLAWKATPRSIVRQQEFVAAFPATAQAFSAIFDPKDFGQLYDGHDYLLALAQIGTSYPGPVLRRGVTIGKEVRGTSDAPSYLRQATIQLALKHPRLLASELARLTSAERQRLFSMWADEEGIADDPDYAALAGLMSKYGFTAYATELQRAKQRRLREPNH